MYSNYYPRVGAYMNPASPGAATPLQRKCAYDPRFLSLSQCGHNFIIHVSQLTDTFNFDAMAAAISTSPGAHIPGKDQVLLNVWGDVLE
jgi:hypothetical protein